MPNAHAPAAPKAVATRGTKIATTIDNITPVAAQSGKPDGFKGSEKTPRTPTKPSTTATQPTDKAATKPALIELVPFDETEDETENAGNTPTQANSKGNQDTGLIGTLIEAKTRLNNLRSNSNAKTELAILLDQAIQEALILTTQQLKSLQHDIKDIKVEIRGMKTPAPETNKTWAQVARQAQAQRQHPSPRVTERRMENLDKIKLERAKVELTLTTRDANEDTKQSLEAMTEEELAKSIESATGYAIRSVRKTNQNITIRCANENEAKALREVDWKTAFPGTEVAKQLYGIVVHGVPKYDVDFEKDNMEEVKIRIAAQNTIHIDKITPLRRRAKNPNASTQSIIIYTEKPEDADGCIEAGVAIEYRNHRAERYMPQHRITQCYNCQGYGHRATECKKPTRCGKCAKEHSTKDCQNPEGRHTCVHCSGDHTAWNPECPRRQREATQKEASREATPPFYTKPC